MTKPGTYRLASKTFRAKGNSEIADAIDSGKLKIAVAGTIAGPVQKRPELADAFREAIAACTEMTPDDRRYYLDGLSKRVFVPVETGGATVYPYGTEAPDKTDRTWSPGELFMKS